jgi:hypothetical protein
MCLVFKYDNSIIYNNDLNYVITFSNNKDFNKLDNNNIKTNYTIKKYNILIITYDNRINERYIHIHNKNINEYVKKWNYKYKFTNTCNYNAYWCKIYNVLDELNTNLYDYVMWMDSDTFINNFNIDIGNIINKYSSDIFIASDNHKKYNIINSGVFIIKNSLIGKQFLSDCINNIQPRCINKNGTLKGLWAASCYEQGIMNLLIKNKYYKNTTILSNDIILNYYLCNKNVFIMHLYANSPMDRYNCFTQN